MKLERITPSLKTNLETYLGLLFSATLAECSSLGLGGTVLKLPPQAGHVRTLPLHYTDTAWKAWTLFRERCGCAFSVMENVTRI
jgi:hypothetical protein